MARVKVSGFDHIVLAVADVARACRFYARTLGMDPREEQPGKWSLHFGESKISLQDAAAIPDMARRTVPGSGNFCLLTDTPIGEVVGHLRGEGVAIVAGPGERSGATGTILSVYFHDPDGNLVEISNRLQP
jgi:catechol 2,3-dioxygenase-like lactoylglutathione lyase family enzyme